MADAKSLIINLPYDRPARHWSPARDGTLRLTPGRRPASYEIIDLRSNTRRVENLDLVNRIRERVEAWREAGYPGVTSVTRTLLDHWNDRSARPDYPFYFCQLEAAETMIWWLEAPAEHRQGIHVPGDGTSRISWCWDVVFEPAQIMDRIETHGGGG